MSKGKNEKKKTVAASKPDSVPVEEGKDVMQPIRAITTSLDMLATVVSLMTAWNLLEDSVVTAIAFFTAFGISYMLDTMFYVVMSIGLGGVEPAKKDIYLKTRGIIQAVLCVTIAACALLFVYYMIR